MNFTKGVTQRRRRCSMSGTRRMSQTPRRCFLDALFSSRQGLNNASKGQRFDATRSEAYSCQDQVRRTTNRRIHDSKNGPRVASWRHASVALKIIHDRRSRRTYDNATRRCVSFVRDVILGCVASRWTEKSTTRVSVACSRQWHRKPEEENRRLGHWVNYFIFGHNFETFGTPDRDQ